MREYLDALPEKTMRSDISTNQGIPHFSNSMVGRVLPEFTKKLNMEQQIGEKEKAVGIVRCFYISKRKYYSFSLSIFSCLYSVGL